MRLTSLIGTTVTTQGGTALGEVCDVRVRQESGLITALLVGRRGLRERLLGGGPEGRKAPGSHPQVLPWDTVLRIEGGRVVVTDDAPARTPGQRP